MEAVFPEAMRQESEADDSTPFSAEVKNDDAIPPHLHTPSWRGA
jgi:hypothetical protein